MGEFLRALCGCFMNLPLSGRDVQKIDEQDGRFLCHKNVRPFEREPGQAYTTVMIAFDGTEASTRAAERAMQIVRPMRDHVVIVRVLPRAEVNVRAERELDECVQVQLGREAKLSMEPFFDKAKAKKIEVTCMIHKCADPREVLCRLTREYHVDFLVVGSRGLRGLKKITLGSTSEYCLRHCPCSVMIVH